MIKFKNIFSYLKKYYPIFLFIFVLCVVIKFDYKYGKQCLDSDMASEMVLANQLNKEKILLSENWFYSTEIRILGNVILFKPLLKLFPNNWRLVRTAAQGILLFLTTVSYFYMSSIFKNRNQNLLFATALICPFGFWYMWLGTFSGGYLIWIIVYNFCVGLIFRISLKKCNLLQSVFRWASLILLSFVIGLQSVRGLMNVQVPLLLASFIMLIMYCYKNKYQHFIELHCLQKIKRFFYASLVSVLFSASGYIINAKVLSKIYTYINQNEICWKTFSIHDFFVILQDFLMLWGYPYNYIKKMEIPLFSMNGFLSFFGILLMAIVAIGFILLIKNANSLKIEKQIVCYSCLAAIFVPFFVFTFLKYDNASYFIPGFGMMILGLQIVYSSIDNCMFKKSIGISSLICILCCSINTSKLFVQYSPRSNNKQEKIAELLIRKGYRNCIGKFWTGGNAITELTNGQVEAWIIDNFETRNIYPWLQSKSHINEFPQGKCAVILNKNEMTDEEIDKVSYEDDKVIYADEANIVFEIEDSGKWLLENKQ